MIRKHIRSILNGYPAQTITIRYSPIPWVVGDPSKPLRTIRIWKWSRED